MLECLGKIAPGPLLCLGLLEGEFEVFLPAKDGRIRSPEGDKDPAIRQMELCGRELGPVQRRLCIHIASDAYVAEPFCLGGSFEEACTFAVEPLGSNESGCFLYASGKVQAFLSLHLI